MLLGAVLIYPALPVIAPFGVNRSEWGPILVLMMMVRQKLLRMLPGELVVLWRHLRRLSIVLLKKRVEVRLVFLVVCG